MRRLLPILLGISAVLLSQTLLQQNYDSRSFAKGSKTSGVQEAINAAAAAGGGVVQLPAGVVTASTITLPNSIPIHLRGSGIGATTLKLADGTNADLITNANFATLTGGGTAPAGIYRVTLSDLTLDGNRTNQSGTSYCFRVYGHGYTIRDVVFQNCLTATAYSEYALDPAFTNTSSDLETYWTNTRHTFSGAGPVFRGPHDSYINNITVYNMNGWCWVNESNGTTYNGNVHVTNMDTYLCALTVPNTGACKVNGNALMGATITCSTATGDGLQLSGAGGTFITGLNAGTSDTSTSVAGLNVLGTTSSISLQGSAGGSGWGWKLSGLQASNLALDVGCGSHGCISVTADAGSNIFRGGANMYFSGAVPLISGTVNDNTWYCFQVFPSAVGQPQNVCRQGNQDGWQHYIVSISGGNWTIVGPQGTVTTTAGAASTSQVLAIDTSNFLYVSGLVLKTKTAFTGATTATTTFGNTGNGALYLSTPYDLKAAVAAGNFAPTDGTLATIGTNSLGSSALALAIATTGANVSALSGSLDIWVRATNLVQ